VPSSEFDPDKHRPEIEEARKNAIASTWIKKLDQPVRAFLMEGWKMSGSRRGNIYAAGVICGIVVCLLAESFHLTKNEIIGQEGWWGGPAGFPLIIGVLLGVCTVIFCWSEIIARLSLTMSEQNYGMPRRTLTLALILIAYVVALNSIGYLFSTVLFFVVYLMVMVRFNWTRSILFGVGGAMLLWVLFVWVAKMPFPKGFTRIFWK
jgi:hypothetical protein